MRKPSTGGSRFNAPPTGEGSARCHDLSGREDVSCCVYVGVGFAATNDASEAGSTSARAGIDHATRRAFLRGVGRRDLDQCSTPSVDLVGELASQLSPARGEDRSVQAGLLRDVHSRCRRRALGTACHRDHVEPLDHDHAVALGDLGREFVEEVSANTRFAGPELGDLVERALMAARSLALTAGAAPSRSFLTARASLQAAKPFRLPWRKRRAGVQVAGRQSDGCRDAAVDPYRRAEAGPRPLHLVLADQGDMPAEGIAGDRQVLDLPLRLSRKAKTNPAQLWDSHLAPAAREPADRDLTLGGPRLDAKTLVEPLALEARVAGLAAKEAHKGAVEIAERLLWNVGMRLSKPEISALGLRKLRPGLVWIAQARAAHAPRCPALLKRCVPYSSGAARPSRHRRLLLGAGIQPVAVSRVFHAVKVELETDAVEGGERPVLYAGNPGDWLAAGS